MSKSLYWTPPPQEVNEHSIDYLKYAIGEYFVEGYRGEGGEFECDKSIIPFLKGVMAVGSQEEMQDAKTLIEAIERYGVVCLTIH